MHKEDIQIGNEHRKYAQHCLSLGNYNKHYTHTKLLNSKASVFQSLGSEEPQSPSFLAVAVHVQPLWETVWRFLSNESHLRTEQSPLQYLINGF